MSVFEVGVDGAIRGDEAALRAVTGWMVRRYGADVRANGGAGSRVLMEFIAACGESVRIREACRVPLPEPVSGVRGKVEVGAADAAQIMGCSPEYVRRLARNGRLAARRLGTVWLIDVTKAAEAQ